jgi:hypothetical protein
LNSKTRILATNAIAVLPEADFIGLLRDRTLVEKGTYEQLLAMKGEVATLIRTSSSDNENGADANKEDKSPISVDSTVASDTADESDLSDIEEAQEGLGPLAPIKAHPNGVRRSSMATLRRASTASWNGVRRDGPDEEDGLKTKQIKEKSEQGKVRWKVYAEYAKESNLYAVTIYMVALLTAQTAQVAGGFWLKRWSEVNEIAGKNPQVGKYIGIYFAFGFGSSALVVIQTLILWIFCSIEASRKFHERMAYAIFRSPMSFFETTPSGRVLNRFSSDIYRVDEVLARTFNMVSWYNVHVRTELD